MAANVSLAAKSVTILRSIDWNVLMAGCTSYAASPDAVLVVLPDSATVQDIIDATGAVNVMTPLPPTG